MTTLILIATLSASMSSTHWRERIVIEQCSQSYDADDCETQELQRLHFERQRCDYDSNDWAECVTDSVKMALRL